MQVRDILARKGRQVCAINHLQPLRDAMTMTHRARIGAVVVVNAASGAAMGTLSQDEVLAGLAELGASTLPHCATGLDGLFKPAALRWTQIPATVRRNPR